MRNILKSLAVIALVVPAMALAAGQITASKHNLSTSGTGPAKATAQDQICVFCHTPHNAAATKLLWNRNSNSAAGWSAGNTTTAGTTLPSSAQIQAPTKNCLSCHDGTQSLGSVQNYNGAATTFTMSGTAVDATGKLNATAYIIGAGNDLNKNHPVSIPYIGATYANGIVSSISGTDANFVAPTTSGCVGSQVCTNGTNKVRLYGSTTATAGIECGSCHEPHITTFGTFLRFNNAASALCQSCHNK